MFRTSFLLVLSAGLWAFAGAFDAQGDELPKPKRNGLFVYGACDAPEGLVVNTGSIQLYVRDETLEVTTVDLAAFGHLAQTPRQQSKPGHHRNEQRRQRLKVN